MNICAICFETMDMQEFEDSQSQTSTCFKLECEHAYHTSCIIRCLSQSGRKCPQCNSEKDPARQLTQEALASKLVNELKRNDAIKPLIAEFKEGKEEYAQTIQQLKKDIKEYAELRAKELCIPDKRKYVMNCLSEIQRTTKSIAAQKGTQYVGAIKHATGRNRTYVGTPSFDRVFFGIQGAYSISRLKYPRLYLELF